MAYSNGIVEFELARQRGAWNLQAAIEPAALEQLQLTRGWVALDDQALPIENSGSYQVELIGPRTVPKLRQMHGNEYGKSLVRFIDHLGAFTTETEEDGRVRRAGKVRDLWLGTEHVSDGRLHMGVVVQRPERASDEAITILATTVMQSVAVELQHGSQPRQHPQAFNNRILESVQASYSREGGVTLTTNALGGCSLETSSPEHYNADSPDVTLTQHNIYNFQQQLVLLCGAVAIAQADELAK